MYYVFEKKDSSELFYVRGNVKKFEDAWKCSLYFDRNKLSEKGYKIVCKDIDEKRQEEFRKYLRESLK